MTKDLKLALLLLFKLILVTLSSPVYSNSISNCSTCGGGFGDKLGEITPKDNHFKIGGITLECPKRKNGSYKTGNNWNSSLSGFYNNNYMWFYQKKVSKFE